jgi:hypothetical protein
MVVVIVMYEANIFVSLQANAIFLFEKEERLSIPVEVFALDRDALGNYCVASEEWDGEGDYKCIEDNKFISLIRIRSNIVK